MQGRYFDKRYDTFGQKLICLELVAIKIILKIRIIYL